MVEQIVSKQCSKCGEIKPVSEFYKRSLSKDGFCSDCKICWDRRQAEYDKSPKGRITRLKAGKKWQESEKGRATKKRYHAERRKQMKNSSVNWDQIKGKSKTKTHRNSRPINGELPTLNSTDWRRLSELVQNEAKDRPEGFFRRQKRNELLVSFLQIGITKWQVIRFNNEDIPCLHGQPHINIRNPRNGECWEKFIDSALQTKIKAYYNEFRRDAGPKDPFLTGPSGRRLSRSGVYQILMGSGPNGDGNHGGLARKLGIRDLSPSIIYHTWQEQYSGKNKPNQKRLKSKEKKWLDNTRYANFDLGYMAATDAIKIAEAMKRKLKLSQLSKILKPNGPIRYMRKEMRGSGRCKVHIPDFLEYIKTLPYIKPIGEQITDEALDKFMANKEAEQVEIREQKNSMAIKR